MDGQRSDKRVTFDALVRELLRLDPCTLAVMDPGKRSAAAGLLIFWRRTLEEALGSLWASDTTKFRFRSDAAARALDWPNASICNLSTFFAWALVREPRHARGLSCPPLLPADPLISDLPQKYVARADTAVGSLVAMVRTLLRAEGETHRRLAIDETQAMSVSALANEMLGVPTDGLLRFAHETPREAEEDFVCHSEGQVASALAAWLMTVLDTYAAVIEREVELVSFLIVDEAGCAKPADARLANLEALLTAALLVDQRDVTFLLRAPHDENGGPRAV